MRCKNFRAPQEGERGKAIQSTDNEPTTLTAEEGGSGRIPCKIQVGYWACFTYPSRSRHNEHRWFLSIQRIPDSYYPDEATPRAEVFAYRDDCTVLQLTDDPTLQPAGGGFYGVHWLPGDEGISFKARRWSGTQVTEGGLYTAKLLYDGDNIIGLTAEPTLVLDFALDSEGWPGFSSSHSWDPTGSRVLYIDTAVGGLSVADLAAGTSTQIFTGQARHPDWSPDGSKILFTLGSSICTIKPNGTGLKKVINPTYVDGVYWSGFGHAYFSPAGDYIVCVGCTSYNGTPDNDVFRATSSGRSLTNLTRTDSLVEIPIGWR